MNILDFAMSQTSVCELVAPNGDALLAGDKPMTVEVYSKNSVQYQVALAAKYRAMTVAEQALEVDGVMPEGAIIPSEVGNKIQAEFLSALTKSVYVQLGKTAKSITTDKTKFYANESLWYFHNQALGHALLDENFLNA